ncbi:MAG: hypothetical protein PVH68_07200 [Armatimonadota bacterium]
MPAAIGLGMLAVVEFAAGPSSGGPAVLQAAGVFGMAVALLALSIAGIGLLRQASWGFRLLVVGIAALAADLVLLLTTVDMAPMAIFSCGPLLLAGCTALAVREESRWQASTAV